MDVNYINPFLLAVQNIFETMIDVTFTLGKPTIKEDQIPLYEVSGVIGISGEVVGCVVVSFPEEVALHLASALLQEQINKIDADCTDAIGEIANMVAGDAKKRFPKSNTSVSVPSVIVGKHRVAFPKGVPIITIPCGTKAGQFSIEVALKVQQ